MKSRAINTSVPLLLISAFLLCGAGHVLPLASMPHDMHPMPGSVDVAAYQEHFLQMTNAPWVKNFAVVFLGLVVVVAVAPAVLLLPLLHARGPVPGPALRPPGVMHWLSLKSLSPPMLVA